MSESIENLSGEIAKAKELSISEQPAAFEEIRKKLEEMISDPKAPTE